MRISWNNMKISIAGAKLSHLVQKDKIWDHGSMTEQARIIFYLVQKANNNGNIESLKKYMTLSCYEKLKKKVNELAAQNIKLAIKKPVIKELAVIEVRRGKNKTPDSFTALIKGYSKAESISRLQANDDTESKFSEQWFFIRQGDWWVLDNMKSQHSVF